MVTGCLLRREANGARARIEKEGRLLVPLSAYSYICIKRANPGELVLALSLRMP